MVCGYCGVETGSGVGHRSQAECIEALSAEIARAKRIINSGHDSRREAETAAASARKEEPPRQA